jgi:protein ImuA
MLTNRADIIAGLRKDLLLLQGFKPRSSNPVIDLGPLNEAFPQATFPTGATHEFLCESPQNLSAVYGFIAGLLNGLMKNGGVSLWITASPALYPPALSDFGVDADKIIFLELKKEKDLAWAFEEALKCDGLSAVISELSQLNFTSSRRFQLAVEQSGVTGFIIRKNLRNNHTTASVSRWKITHIPAIGEEDLPGIGHPQWKVELLRIRNGKPGCWSFSWSEGKFQHALSPPLITREFRKKTG